MKNISLESISRVRNDPMIKELGNITSFKKNSAINLIQFRKKLTSNISSLQSENSHDLLAKLPASRSKTDFKHLLSDKYFKLQQNSDISELTELQEAAIKGNQLKSTKKQKRRSQKCPQSVQYANFFKKGKNPSSSRKVRAKMQSFDCKSAKNSEFLSSLASREFSHRSSRKNVKITSILQKNKKQNIIDAMEQLSLTNRKLSSEKAPFHKRKISFQSQNRKRTVFGDITNTAQKRKASNHDIDSYRFVKQGSFRGKLSHRKSRKQDQRLKQKLDGLLDRLTSERSACGSKMDQVEVGSVYTNLGNRESVDNKNIGITPCKIFQGQIKYGNLTLNQYTCPDDMATSSSFKSPQMKSNLYIMPHKFNKTGDIKFKKKHTRSLSRHSRVLKSEILQLQSEYAEGKVAGELLKPGASASKKSKLGLHTLLTKKLENLKISVYEEDKSKEDFSFNLKAQKPKFSESTSIERILSHDKLLDLISRLKSASSPEINSLSDK